MPLEGAKILVLNSAKKTNPLITMNLVMILNSHLPFPAVTSLLVLFNCHLLFLSSLLLHFFVGGFKYTNSFAPRQTKKDLPRQSSAADMHSNIGTGVEEASAFKCWHPSSAANADV